MRCVIDSFTVFDHKSLRRLVTMVDTFGNVVRQIAVRLHDDDVDVGIDRFQVVHHVRADAAGVAVFDESDRMFV